jgi:2-succinyl-5-enolpyruvyl-6-hydroxy-3-cyclohexene-1-carboxylate synthase
VVVGYADFTAEERTAIAALAQSLGAPLLADPTSNFNDPGTIRHYDVFLRAPSAVERLPCDAVIRFGAPPVSKALGRFVATRRPALHVIVDPHGEWQEPLAIDSIFMRASFLSVARDLFDITKSVESNRAAVRASWTTLETHSLTAIRAAVSERSAPGHAIAAATLGAHLREHDHVHVASSLPIRDFDIFARIESKATLGCNRGVNGIDGTFSTALGVAFARATHPGRTWALVGDVAALHDLGGLLAASQQRVDATLVVVNNDGGAIFGLLPVARHGDIFERFFSTPHGRTLAGTAELFGVQYHRVDELDVLPELLERSRSQQGVVLVEVIVDRIADAERYRALMSRLASEIDSLILEAV